jgi:predicted neuraminidase
MKHAFVFEDAPFPSCHASTVVETDGGRLLCAWFAGTEEGANDVGIWLAEWDGREWSRLRVVASDPEQPCWNPALFRTAEGEVLLFYKAGPNPSNWSGLLKRSRDQGRTWTDAEWLPAGILGPIKNKPAQLPSGEIICGSSVESYHLWGCWAEITPDAGRTWSKHGPINVPGHLYGIIQPAVVPLSETTIRFLCRSRRLRRIVSATSRDAGRSWSDATLTELPHPGSGIDAVALRDGRVALVYNHTETARHPINLAFSPDGGDTWQPPILLEDLDGELSYPAIIQAADGRLHLTYTWRRARIRHVIVEPSEC